MQHLKHYCRTAQYGDLKMHFVTCTGQTSQEQYKSLQHKGHKVSSGLAASNDTMKDRISWICRYTCVDNQLYYLHEAQCHTV